MRRRARIIQVVCDLTKKPISELRILDLASLEGHFSFEFASKGAQVTGIEGRQSNIEKALALGERLKLKPQFVKDDVRNLSSEEYGVFDVVLCLGILYHLDAPDIKSFLETLYEVCRDFVVIDTHVGLSPVEKFGKYSGYYFTEYECEPSPEEREKSSWSSIGNVKSFWLTKPSLVSALADVGFTSVMEVHFPTMNDMAADRVTLVAFKGKPEMPTVEFTDPSILGERPPEFPAVRSRHQPVRRNGGLYSQIRRYLRNKSFLLLVLISLAGVLTILYSTSWGIGIGHDQLGYIQGAENLVRGQGYSHFTPLGELKATIQWPPFYSLTLSTFGLVGISVVEGARWLNALLFGINILLVGFIAYRKTSLWPAVFASFLILTSGVMLGIHTVAFSEPLYIFLGLVGLYFLDTYLNNSRSHLLILAALSMGIATVTRYMGVTLIATLCIGVIFLGKRPWRRRFLDCFIAGLVASLPLLMWIVRNRLVTGQTASRHLQVHFIKLRHLREGLYTVALWFLPERIPSSSTALTLLAVVSVVSGLLIIPWFRNRSAATFFYLNALYIVTYCLGLALFISFVSLDLAFDARYLSPVFVSGVLILSLCVHRITFQASKPIVVGVAVLCVFFSFFYSVRAFLFVNKIHRDGWGWENRFWKQSELVTAVKNLPGDTRIYANYATGIAYLSQRKIGDLPIKFDEHTEIPSADYHEKLKEIGETSRTRRTAIIYINWFRPHFISEDELQQTLGLRKIVSTPQGSIYEVSSSKEGGQEWQK